MSALSSADFYSSLTFSIAFTVSLAASFLSYLSSSLLRAFSTDFSVDFIAFSTFSALPDELPPHVHPGDELPTGLHSFYRAILTA